ncbi:hypothetical protein ANO11243_070580 [Dothideomycetidae sp. 11243]|nr:hypothetical protein ANO11243_070580 [fungal sp. No.11243]
MSPTKGSYGYNEATRPSPRSRDQKQVTFELLLPTAQSRARLPMRVMICKHDTTDSIITTVKNFYGLYEGPGVSFQDRDGNIMIAAYENFDDGMVVFVKVSEELPLITSNEVPTPVSSSPKKPKLGPPIEMRPPTHTKFPGYHSANRSPSPSSAKSFQTGSNASGKHKARSQKGQEQSNANDNYGDQLSDSDGGNGSVASSRRSRADAHASAEISVDNILEGGRRKRAKFESCELPLFVPPQVPVTTSLSSVSPQRRMNGEAASPLPFTNQRTFTYAQPLPSPQSFGRSEGYNGASAYPINYGGQPGAHQLRGRQAGPYLPPRRSGGVILPTPEPTVGSVISDEDVALQLMRLGDMANMSHGRTSTSTMDDALSGKADAASSEEDSEDNDDELALPGPRYPIATTHDAGPRRKRQRLEDAQAESESSEDDYNDDSFKGDSDEVMPEYENDGTRRRMSKGQIPGRPTGIAGYPNGAGKEHKVKSSKTKSKSAPDNISRKASVSSTSLPLGPDEEDLSSRPRCQRCRKSKKGCDRQRPCGRCKDAGIGIEGCISEDEGNGRRGRYGRHMGVAVKKEGVDETQKAGASPADTLGGVFLTPAIPVDKNKKRKRSS